MGRKALNLLYLLRKPYLMDHTMLASGHEHWNGSTVSGEFQLCSWTASRTRRRRTLMDCLNRILPECLLPDYIYIYILCRCPMNWTCTTAQLTTGLDFWCLLPAQNNVASLTHISFPVEFRLGSFTLNLTKQNHKNIVLSRNFVATPLRITQDSTR